MPRWRHFTNVIYAINNAINGISLNLVSITQVECQEWTYVLLAGKTRIGGQIFTIFGLKRSRKPLLLN